MFELDSVVVLGLFKLVLAVVGIVVGRLTLFWFDKFFANTPFTKWLESANDEAKAVYYAGRFVGIALIIGCAIG